MYFQIVISKSNSRGHTEQHDVGGSVSGCRPSGPRWVHWFEHCSGSLLYAFIFLCCCVAGGLALGQNLSNVLSL
jgi:hypothetical protein